jgi:hypothetical protein
VIGVLLGLWGARLVYLILFEPASVPLVEKVLGPGLEGLELGRIVETGDGPSVELGEGARPVLLGAFVTALFLAFGGIVTGFLTGGAKLIEAIWGGRLRAKAAGARRPGAPPAPDQTG